VRIVALLAQEPECRGSDVFASLPLAQSTVSQHLAILKEAGVVVVHSFGQSNVYCIAPELLKSFAAEVSAMVADVAVCSADSEECR
jgi:ArsR family transcriptional regulator